MKVQHHIQRWSRCAHVAFLKLINFKALFCFASFDQFETVDWLKSKSLTRYHVYSRLKTITKTFLEKVLHVSAQQTYHTFVFHF